MTATVYRTAGNPTDRPQPAGDDGQTIGGGEFGPVVAAAAAVVIAIGDERLRWADRPDDVDTDTVRPDALEAWDATDAANAALDELAAAGLDADGLADLEDLRLLNPDELEQLRTATAEDLGAPRRRSSSTPPPSPPTPPAPAEEK